MTVMPETEPTKFLGAEESLFSLIEQEKIKDGEIALPKDATVTKGRYVWVRVRGKRKRLLRCVDGVNTSDDVGEVSKTTLAKLGGQRNETLTQVSYTNASWVLRVALAAALYVAALIIVAEAVLSAYVLFFGDTYQTIPRGLSWAGLVLALLVAVYQGRKEIAKRG